MRFSIMQPRFCYDKALPRSNPDRALGFGAHFQGYLLMSQHLPVDPAINVSVTASAGTGKTWLLVTRIIRLLLEGARPQGILAITFTRKAASEMQQRLLERLLELAACDQSRLDELLADMGLASKPAMSDRARRLYEALLYSERTVNTTTFHAFCADILRRFPLDADVPPGFELLDRTGALQQEAIEALFAESTPAFGKEAFGKEASGSEGFNAKRSRTELAPALTILFHACGGLYNTEQALTDFLNHRSDWWAYTEGRPDPVAYACGHLAEQLALEPEPLAEMAGSEFLTALEELAELLARLASRTARAQRLAGTLAAAIAEQSAERRLALLREAFLTRVGEPRSHKFSKAAMRVLTAGERQRVDELCAQVGSAVMSAADQYARHATYRASCTWYLAGQRLIEHYQWLKAQRRMLDFADLEWRAYRLLNSDGQAHWIQYKLDARIDHLLVDELQDTNPTQWHLLLPLLEELAAGSQRARSVFLVGDPKQSIYRFRRADARLLGSATRWVAEHLAARSFPLHLSRRSAPAILELINRVFGDTPLRERLAEFQPHATHHHALWGRVELLPLVVSDASGRSIGRSSSAQELRNPLKRPRVTDEDRRHYREGEMIATRILDLVGDLVGRGATVLSEGQVRRMHFGDCVILLRTRSHARAYELALRAARIPYLGADRGTLLDSQEARDLEALLRTLVLPYDNLSLAVVLRSPLFHASDGDLMQLASPALQGTWMERLETLAPALAPGSPLAHAHRCIGCWRELAGRLPVHDLLDRVYCEGNVRNRFVAAAPEHLKSRVGANLDRFIELALEIDSGRYSSVPQFLSRLRELREQAQDAPDEAPAPPAEPRVRILTIHASKGLEAPVVFLADATHTARPRKVFQALVDWPADAPRPQSLLLSPREPDRFSTRLLAAQALAEQREDANLLYVALTRARQFLFISGCAPAPARKKSRERSQDGAEQRSARHALGWYGEVARAFGLDPDRIPAGTVLTSSGEPPEAAASPALQAPAQSLSTQPASLDPRLSSPLEAAAHAPVRFQPEGPISADAPERTPRSRMLRRALGLLTRGDRLLQPLLRHAALQQLALEVGIAADDQALARAWEEACSVVDEPSMQEFFDAAYCNAAFNEAPLHFVHKGQIVHAAVDRLVIREREMLVIAYDTRHDAARSNLEQLVQAHRERLSLWAEGVHGLWPDRTVRALVLFTACAAMVELEVMPS